jgi:hypothetical protein
MKAYIITLSDNEASVQLAANCRKSVMQYCNPAIQPLHFEAVQPKNNMSSCIEIFGEYLSYTYPESPLQSRMDFKTNLFLKAYDTDDVRKVISCSLSHMMLWKECVDTDEQIMILEHDALFHKKFSYLDYKSYPGWGTIGLNCPRGNTRKGNLYADRIQENGQSIQNVPQIDSSGDLPLPNGLAGNSAYMIRPFAAKQLLDKTMELGIWPNDAIMCEQLFPWLRVAHPFYTTTQRNVSSTTKQL